MAIFKCKMCGGTIEFEEGATVGTCDSCGTRQTLPRLDGDKKANLYDRANHFRRNDEFDKAMGIYEQILNEDSTDAEAYWSLVLCRYGIEYVEDPASHRRVPTVNRAQFTSIFDDDNYKSALHYADAHQRALYEEEAKAINEIQKGILEISQKEEPFDVFICYKETDSSGKRTPDSVLAHELYHQLTQEDFKVFFARITLEDKLGSAYEPYIFAALNSAKVMVVLGTKPEFFQAAWVKNEWSRYLTLIKNGAEKLLIPAYKDMDPYDLPEEFSHLQAQDMSKLGFMQDLIRGINKIIGADEKPAGRESAAANGGSGSVSPLLKRVSLFLEDGDWAKADEFCEQVLNQEPENAQAYLGKLMAEIKVKNQSALKDCKTPFDDNNNYQKVLRFGDEELAAELKGYIVHINERNEQDRLLGIYEDGVAMMNSAYSEEDCKLAAHTFQKICGFKNADTLAEQCLEKAEVFRKDTIYEAARAKMKGPVISHYESAIKLLESIPGWKDAEEQISLCRKKIEEFRAEEEAKRLESERQAEIARKEAEERAKRNKKIALITASIVGTIAVFVIALNAVIIPNAKYSKAVALMDKGKFDEAYGIFTELGDYKDSFEKSDNTQYNKAIALMGEDKFDEAYSIFTKLDDYKDSAEKAGSIRLLKNKDELKNCKVGDYIKFGIYEQDNDFTNSKEAIEWLVLEVKDGKALVISRYILDCKQYNTSKTNVTWDICTLREWLNNDFISTAFSDMEKAMIPTVTISTEEYSTSADNPTLDKVFLLSITEAEAYFSSNDARKCRATMYANAQGAYAIGADENCEWWLRSPGHFQSHAASVTYDGEINKYGSYTTSAISAVRPALWIDLED